MWPRARSPRDVILTVDISRLTGAEEAGVTQAIESEALKDAIPLSAGRRRALVRRDHPGPRRLPLRGARADGDVTTYETLAGPESQGRLCTCSGTHPYTLALTAAVIERHGEAAAAEWLEGVEGNLARQPQGDDRARVRAIWPGECDLSLGSTDCMGMMLGDPEEREWTEGVRIVFPTFEEGGTHVDTSRVAMTAAAPHREDALASVGFLVSPEAQEI